MATKTWFITGTSRGLGREWALAALERGDRVVATARQLSSLDDLVNRYGDAVLALELDVTDRQADFAAVQRAHGHFGRLDVVVNNAGYGQFGFVEELSEADVRDQMEANFFGAMWVTQAALPLMREQGEGHIVQVSSIGGISSFANSGMYCASKWGLEGFSQALAQEVADFGIQVTLVEPGGFATDWAGPSSRTAEPLDVYTKVREELLALQDDMYRPGDPNASAAAILRVVDADPPPERVFFGSTPPRRVFFGATALEIAQRDYELRLAEWREWQPVADLAQGGS